MSQPSTTASSSSGPASIRSTNQSVLREIFTGNKKTLAVLLFLMAGANAISFVIVPTMSMLYNCIAPVRWIFSVIVFSVRWIFSVIVWFWNLSSGGLSLEFVYWRTLFDMQIDWWMRYIWAAIHCLAVKCFTIFNLAFMPHTHNYHKFMIISLGTCTLFCPSAIILPFSLVLSSALHLNKVQRRRCMMMLIASWTVILVFEINVRCALSIGYSKTLPSLDEVRTEWSCDMHFDDRNCSQDAISARDEFLLYLPHFRLYRWTLSLFWLGSESVLKDYLFGLGQFIFISTGGIFWYVFSNCSDISLALTCVAFSTAASLLVPYVTSAAGLFMPLAVFLALLYDVCDTVMSACVSRVQRFKKYVTRRKKDEKSNKIRLVRQISVPTEWEDFDINSTSSVANLVPLSKTHTEYQRIMNQYKSTGGKLVFFRSDFRIIHNRHVHTQEREQYSRSFKFKHPIYGFDMHTVDQ